MASSSSATWKEKDMRPNKKKKKKNHQKLKVEGVVRRGAPERSCGALVGKVNGGEPVPKQTNEKP